MRTVLSLGSAFLSCQDLYIQSVPRVRSPDPGTLHEPTLQIRKPLLGKSSQVTPWVSEEARIWLHRISSRLISSLVHAKQQLPPPSLPACVFHLTQSLLLPFLNSPVPLLPTPQCDNPQILMGSKLDLLHPCPGLSQRPTLRVPWK